MPWGGSTTLLALVGAFALGAGAATWLGPRPQPAPAMAPPAPGTPPLAVRSGGPACAPGPDLDAIRAAVREELAAQTAPGRAAEPATGPTAASPTAALAVAEGERRLDAALVAGRWRNDDRLALIGLIGELPTVERDRLLERLAAAINDGILRVETDGPPM